MLSRLLVALASVVASVGLLIYGMGTSYFYEREWMKSLGMAMMVGGVIALAIGIVWYRKTEEAEEAAVEAEIRRRS